MNLSLIRFAITLTTPFIFSLHFSLRQVLNFTEDFYAPPVVMVTVNHLYDSTNVYSVKPENNVLNTWIEVSYHLA